MNIQTPDLCIYHGHCPDGFTSAWAVWRKYGNSVEYRHGSYGSPLPTVDGKHVLMVDFSTDAATMRDLASRAASITVLDHHKTAEAALTPLFEGGTISGVFDMDRSGAGITWDVLHPGEKRPVLVNVVEDRDLWRWEFGDISRFLCKYLDTHEMTFTNWNNVAEDWETTNGYNESIKIGSSLYQQHMKNCDSLISATTSLRLIAGHVVPCANVPMMFCSEVGNLLAKREDAPFGASFFVNKDGDLAFSLRSLDEKVDVSEIAKQFGGGGHRNAAGFRLDYNDLFERVVPDTRVDGDVT